VGYWETHPRKRCWIVEDIDACSLNSTKCVEALKGEVALPAIMSLADKTDIMNKARRLIVLCFKDKVLREVMKDTTVAVTWSRLESLYMTKSLVPRQFLKQKLYPLMWRLRAICSSLIGLWGYMCSGGVFFGRRWSISPWKQRHLQVYLDVEKVIFWSDVKHSTSTYTCGTKNTQG